MIEEQVLVISQEWSNFQIINTLSDKLLTLIKDPELIYRGHVLIHSDHTSIVNAFKEAAASQNSIIGTEQKIEKPLTQILEIVTDHCNSWNPCKKLNLNDFFYSPGVYILEASNSSGMLRFGWEYRGRKMSETVYDIRIIV